MTNQIKIGPAIKRRRRELGWTLQQLCDETRGELYTGYLSDIENEKSKPSYDKAYHIARALRTTIEDLVGDGQPKDPGQGPAEVTNRAPVIPWEMAHEWAKNPDISRLPSGTSWELPCEPNVANGFYLRQLDETMHAPAGPAFPSGSLIFVAPYQEAQANDYVVGYISDPKRPTFKKLVRDGEQLYLRALNPQFPMQQIDGEFKVIGVVLGSVLKVSRGLVR